MIFTAEKVLLIVTFIFFLSETEIIVPNTGGETLNGKTYWHLGLLKWACTHTHKHAHRQTLSDAVRQLVYAEAGFLPGISFHLSSVFRREEGWKRWRRMERRKADEWMLRRKWGWMTKMHAFYNPLNAQNRIRLTAFFSLQGCQKNNFVIQPNLLKPLQFTCSRNTLLKPINPSLYVCVLPHAHTKTEPTEEFSCGVEPRGAY